VRRALRFAAAIALVSCAPVAAQTRPAPKTVPKTAPKPKPVPFERVYLSLNGMFQTAASDFQDRLTYRENAEDAQVDTDYSLKSGPGLDIAGGFVVLRGLGIGVGVTRYSQSSGAAITASIPHPFFFNQSRSITGDVAELKREELGLHVQVRGIFPIGRHMQVMMFGGPSFYKVEQALVSSIRYTDSYPYDVAAFDSAVTTSAEESKIGANLGGDFGYFFTRQVGVGVGAQYMRANLDFPSSDGGTVKVKAGGFQVVGGLRLRF
jgi:opacity protein-like surface antigen